MKKIVIIDGGPRRNMNTAQMLQSFAEGAKSVNEEIEIKSFRLYDLDYKGCMSCMACKVKGKAVNICKFKDPLTPILEEIAQADGLVLGSPIYFGDVTGQMRTFLERLCFPWLSYNDYSMTAPKRMPVVLIETPRRFPDRRPLHRRGHLHASAHHERHGVHQEQSVYLGHAQTLHADRHPGRNRSRGHAAQGRR